MHLNFFLIISSIHKNSFAVFIQFAGGWAAAGVVRSRFLFFFFRQHFANVYCIKLLELACAPFVCSLILFQFFFPKHWISERWKSFMVERFALLLLNFNLWFLRHKKKKLWKSFGDFWESWRYFVDWLFWLQPKFWF